MVSTIDNGTWQGSSELLSLGKVVFCIKLFFYGFNDATHTYMVAGLDLELNGPLWINSAKAFLGGFILMVAKNTAVFRINLAFDVMAHASLYSLD